MLQNVWCVLILNEHTCSSVVLIVKIIVMSKFEYVIEVQQSFKYTERKLF